MSERMQMRERVRAGSQRPPRPSQAAVRAFQGFDGFDGVDGAGDVEVEGVVLVTPEKIPDLRALVKQGHTLGMEPRGPARKCHSHNADTGPSQTACERGVRR